MKEYVCRPGYWTKCDAKNFEIFKQKTLFLIQYWQVQKTMVLLTVLRPLLIPHP